MGITGWGIAYCIKCVIVLCVYELKLPWSKQLQWCHISAFKKKASNRSVTDLLKWIFHTKGLHFENYPFHDDSIIPLTLIKTTEQQ